MKPRKGGQSGPAKSEQVKSGPAKSGLTAKPEAQQFIDNQGAGGMPEANSEVDAIETAYGEHVETLYKNLVMCLLDGGPAPGPGAEQQCIRHFTTGLNLARRARELALTICSETAAPKVSLAPPAAAPKAATPSSSEAAKVAASGAKQTPSAKA